MVFVCVFAVLAQLEWYHVWLALGLNVRDSAEVRTKPQYAQD